MILESILKCKYTYIFLVVFIMYIVVLNISNYKPRKL